MNKRRRFLVIGLAIAMSAAAAADRAVAVAYQATLLTTPTQFYGNASGISGTSIVGGTSLGATLWNGATNTYVSLNPGPDWNSFANAVDGNHQVGSGEPSTGSNEHALLWSGTAASYVDLHPDGFDFSLARGVSGNTQVGSGLPNRQPWWWRRRSRTLVARHSSERRRHQSPADMQSQRPRASMATISSAMSINLAAQIFMPSCGQARRIRS